MVAANYLPYARVLTESFLSHHPDGEMFVLVVDDEQGAVSDEAFRVVRPSDLPLSQRQFREMATSYDVLELSTSLKPWLMRLLGDAGQPVTYLDPDIEIFSNLGEADDLAGSHELVLTPHFLAPPPRDGLHPSENDILIAGTYNLGFLTIAPSATDFLSWWVERLERDCIVDPGAGYFVDQRWLDLGAHYFNAGVIRDPGWNVAYWNLHERPLQRDGEERSVLGQRLRFFHFSGFDPQQPQILSRHQVGRPRVGPADCEQLRSLCDRYAEKLLEAGYGEAQHARYGFSTSRSGVELTRPIRRAYRDALRVSPPAPDAFDDENASGFAEWANALPPASTAHESTSLIRAVERVFRRQLGPVKRAVQRRWSSR